MERYTSDVIRVGKTQCEICKNNKKGICKSGKKPPKKGKCDGLEVW